MKAIFSKRTRPAFTLLEMVVAITVFTIFIGFSLNTYLSFQRSDGEVLVERQVLFEAEAILDRLSHALQTQSVLYSEYASAGQESALKENTLYLLSADEQTESRFAWDAVTKTLWFSERKVGEGWGEALRLHSENVSLSALQFIIAPSDDPFDKSNRETDALQFQPLVTVKLTAEAQGKVRDTVRVDLQTSVVTRQYD